MTNRDAQIETKNQELGFKTGDSVLVKKSKLIFTFQRFSHTEEDGTDIFWLSRPTGFNGYFSADKFKKID